jgi:hypothetical protein
LEGKEEGLEKCEQEFKLVSELAELEGNVAEACKGDHRDEKFLNYIDRCMEYTSRATKIGRKWGIQL